MTFEMLFSSIRGTIKCEVSKTGPQRSGTAVERGNSLTCFLWPPIRCGGSGYYKRKGTYEEVRFASFARQDQSTGQTEQLSRRRKKFLATMYNPLFPPL